MDGLVVNAYIPHNRRTPLQAEEALGPISIPRGSGRVDPFQRNCASRECNNPNGVLLRHIRQVKGQ
jgi:hypothetical protein